MSMVRSSLRAMVLRTPLRRGRSRRCSVRSASLAVLQIDDAARTWSAARPADGRLAPLRIWRRNCGSLSSFWQIGAIGNATAGGDVFGATSPISAGTAIVAPADPLKSARLVSNDGPLASDRQRLDALLDDQRRKSCSTTELRHLRVVGGQRICRPSLLPRLADLDDLVPALGLFSNSEQDGERLAFAERRAVEAVERLAIARIVHVRDAGDVDRPGD